MNEITQLKAQAYDIINAIETLQRELQKINELILQKSKENHERGNSEHGN